MSIDVKNIVIGEGKPKVCVPVVEHTQEDIISKLKEFDQLDIDLIELRIDFFDELENLQKDQQLFETITNLNMKKPLILTCRTLKEGGEVDIELSIYKEIYQTALNCQTFDIYDVELSAGTNLLIELGHLIHDAGKYVLMSYHNFQRTPEKESLLQKFKIMDSFEADLFKVAVMPENYDDVLSLLEVTVLAHDEYPGIPIITMSMSQLGLISRLSGEQYGSAMTFGCVGKTSAPGQIEYDDLNTVLNVIHKSL